jgi:succinate dehydrogenase / fumarate reductase, cytochrome b subunit
MHNRPIYLNLFQLHLPLTGWVSLLHRVTGVVLFLVLPLALYLLQRSLSDQAGFHDVSAMLDRPAGRLLLLAVISSMAHHVFAGVRHLALDIHWGVEKSRAWRSAHAVMIATALVTLIAAWKLFL